MADNREVRSILSVCRAGESFGDDARFEVARRQAEGDPALAQWWAEEQELDRIITAKLQTMPVPPGLRERLTPPRTSSAFAHRRGWRRVALLAAAAVVALAVIFSSWQGPFQPANSAAEYRDEMVSFIKVAPNLEMQSRDLSTLKEFLAKTGAPASLELPEKLRTLEPVGCRVLRFRGHDVSLLCFNRGKGRLVHLFIVPAAALPRDGESGAPSFAAEGEWMTAAWVEGGETYLMTVQGDRDTARSYLVGVGAGQR